MKHIDQLIESGAAVPSDFITKATGKYYTPKHLATDLINSIVELTNLQEVIKVVDPFGGDGRLIKWLLEIWVERNLPSPHWDIEIWDRSNNDLSSIRSEIASLFPDASITLTTKTCDAFEYAIENVGKFDVVLTNPPWELLKPDARELKSLDTSSKAQYLADMKSYDSFLSRTYPSAQPLQKFAGWGTNLSRVGLDASLSLLKKNGLLGIIIPASFLADGQSFMLRERVLTEYTLEEVSYYPAEAKLFDGVDTSVATMIISNKTTRFIAPKINLYDKYLKLKQSNTGTIDEGFLKLNEYMLPISMGVYSIDILQKLQNQFQPFSKLEAKNDDGIWAGREIDETGYLSRLTPDPNAPIFIKGKMVSRFSYTSDNNQRLKIEKPLISTEKKKIVWRDVSRPSQSRRIIATIVPEGFVAGNSLGVAYFHDQSDDALKGLLGIMSSIIFEFQLRCHLATGHISLSSIRKVYLPARETFQASRELIAEVDRMLEATEDNSPALEAIVAKYVYQLPRVEFKKILRIFPGLTELNQNEILEAYDALPTKKLKQPKNLPPQKTMVIPNHLSATLSELDLRMVYSVPPGGNWKNIPHDIPSKRLEQIRESFAQGKGSRSTYYGRLHPDRPSYTITTYFNRPGNGAHMHYSQNRVISQREAARLQSFPDDYAFVGSQGSVNTQIGNAVPPLLAYQIAKTLGKPGIFIDLFSGAGGLGLGFKWAGWKPIVANDIDATFLKSYSANVHENTLHGSISDPEIVKQLVEIAEKAKRDNPGVPFWVLGGPPCQGFSTAGKRNKDDIRNQLFWDYKNYLDIIKPDGFVFENVTGLISMEKGKVFEEVKKAFSSVIPNIQGWVLNIDEYAVPQRRKRVILVGAKDTSFIIQKPEAITTMEQNLKLFPSLKPAISVKEAIGDLPAILPGQDGSDLNYLSDPKTTYQAFMRNIISPKEYIERVIDGSRDF